MGGGGETDRAPPTPHPSCRPCPGWQPGYSVTSDLAPRFGGGEEEGGRGHCHTSPPQLQHGGEISQNPGYGTKVGGQWRRSGGGLCLYKGGGVGVGGG